MKEQKVLDKFCRKLVAMDMDIFGLRGMANDADPDKKSDWITMNGTPVFVGKGETPKEAGKRFAAKKESERASSSPTKNDDNDWVHPDTYGAANPEGDEKDNWTHEDPWKDNGIMENSNERRALHNEKKTSSKVKNQNIKKLASKHADTLSKQLEWEKQRRQQNMSQAQIDFENIESEHKKNIDRFKSLDESYRWRQDKYWENGTEENKKKMEEAFAAAKAARDKLRDYEERVYLPAREKLDPEQREKSIKAMQSYRQSFSE